MHDQGAASREVIDVKDIVSIVGMVPLPLRQEEAEHPQSQELYSNRYFVVQKLALDMVWIGREDEDEEVDNEEE